MKNKTITKKIAELHGWRFDILYPGDFIVARLITMDNKFKLHTEKWIVGKNMNDLLKQIQESPAL